MPGELHLREPRRDDWIRVHGWGSDPAACRYQVWGPNTEQETKDFVELLLRSWELPEQKRVRWSWLAEHARHGVIGAGDLHLRSATHRQGEIAYVVHPDYWGRGFATMIGQLLLKAGFGDFSLHRIYATCDPRNLPSAAVLRKLGMTYEGRLRHTALLRDGWRDSEMFSILDSEWESA